MFRKGGFTPEVLEPRRRIDQTMYAVAIGAYAARCTSVHVHVRDDALGQVVSWAVLIVTGITIDGDREILGADVGDTCSPTSRTAKGVLGRCFPLLSPAALTLASPGLCRSGHSLTQDRSATRTLWFPLRSASAAGVMAAAFRLAACASGSRCRARDGLPGYFTGRACGAASWPWPFRCRSFGGLGPRKRRRLRHRLLPRLKRGVTAGPSPGATRRHAAPRSCPGTPRRIQRATLRAGSRR